MKRAEESVAYFLSGFSCSQAVLCAFAEEYGLSKENALKLADAFGGGMGGMGRTCGAVTAAFMVIGLKHGRADASDLAGKEETRRFVKLLSEEFTALHGSTVCSELLECDMDTVEGKKNAKDSGLFVTACPKYVKCSVELLEKLLYPAGEPESVV
jgi:C_GCAxxG_C_C family probable redox protein